VLQDCLRVAGADSFHATVSCHTKPVTNPATACLACCRQNIDDALAKLQEMIDAAVEFCTPKEADPETIKKIEKR
jgi:hypothetical protein